MFTHDMKKLIFSVKFTKDGSKFILGGDNNEITFWDFDEMKA